MEAGDWLNGYQEEKSQRHFFIGFRQVIIEF